LAWIEWYGVPLLVPNRGGPMPYIQFAPQLLGLWLGCGLFVFRLLVFRFPVPLRWRHRLLYAAAPASYFTFHIVRFGYAVIVYA
jgi:hypothetical protein